MLLKTPLWISKISKKFLLKAPLINSKTNSHMDKVLMASKKRQRREITMESRSGAKQFFCFKNNFCGMDDQDSKKFSSFLWLARFLESNDCFFNSFEKEEKSIEMRKPQLIFSNYKGLGFVKVE